MEEKDAVVFTTFKSKTGFVINATQRGDSLAEAYVKLGEFIKDMEGVPYEKSFSKPISASGGLCKVHEVEMKLNKNGKPYHSEGKYPDLKFCNGKGFPTDIADEVNEAFEKNDPVNF
jgi:hypothetical protein